MFRMTKKLKIKQADLTKIEADIKGLFTRLGMTRQLSGYELLNIWEPSIDKLFELHAPKIDIAVLKAKTFPIKLNKKMELVVGVRSASLANELQFMKAVLLEAFAQVSEEHALPKIQGIIFELR